MKVGMTSSLCKVPDESLEFDKRDIEFKDCVKYLGVKLDQTLSMNNQISSVCRACFLELNREALATLISTKVLSRLDYCNSTYTGIPAEQLNRLQRVQNAAAQLVLSKRKNDHITPLLKRLHWLPVKARCDYKIATLVYQFFDGALAPSLASSLQVYRPTRNLYSANEKLLTPQSYKLKSAGGRSFSVSAPRIWNNLPLFVRDSLTLDTFKKRLKTHLFNHYFT